MLVEAIEDNEVNEFEVGDLPVCVVFLVTEVPDGDIVLVASTHDPGQLVGSAAPPSPTRSRPGTSRIRCQWLRFSGCRSPSAVSSEPLSISLYTHVEDHIGHA